MKFAGVSWKWFDLWIGAYIDVEFKRLFVVFPPTIVWKFTEVDMFLKQKPGFWPGLALGLGLGSLQVLFFYLMFHKIAPRRKHG